MKKLCLLSFCFAFLSVQAQVFNNPDFEMMETCPPAFDSELTIQTTMSGWIAVQGTADGYHTSCSPIHPDNTPGLPDQYTGEGFAGVWGPGEVFGQELNSPIDPTKAYCIEVDVLLSEVSGEDPLQMPDCTRLCVYASNTAPPPVNPIFPPSPLETMPDITLLGCSDPNTNLNEWESRTILLLPDTSFQYLFFTSTQGSECNLHNPYLCLDNFEISECEALSAFDTDNPDIKIYPNPFAESVEVKGFPETTRRIEVRSITGALIAEHQVKEGESSVNLNIGKMSGQVLHIVFTGESGEFLFREKVIGF